MEIRFTVGELAKLGGLSKQTLIFYDREGVFRPSYVEPANGYRYYSADQLEALDSILILREMGLSLREIRAHLEARSGPETVALLREQHQAVQNKIADWTLIGRRLERKLESLEALAASRADGAWLVERPLEYLAAEPVEGARGLLEVDVALKRLLRRSVQEKLPHFYQVGDMVAREDLEAGRFLRFQYAFLPLQTARSGLGILEKPAGLYARRYHVGTYETMGRDYAALLAQIREAGYEPAGPSYEFCVLDHLAAGSPEDYVTEIQIPVQKARG